MGNDGPIYDTTAFPETHCVLKQVLPPVHSFIGVDVEEHLCAGFSVRVQRNTVPVSLIYVTAAWDIL